MGKRILIYPRGLHLFKLIYAIKVTHEGLLNWQIAAGYCEMSTSAEIAVQFYSSITPAPPADIRRSFATRMGQVNSCLIINQVCFVAFAHLPTVWTNQIMTQCPANVYEPVNSQKQHKACFSSFSSCFLCKNNLQCCLCVKQSHQTGSLRWVFNNLGSIRGLKCPEKRSLSVLFTIYFVLF